MKKDNISQLGDYDAPFCEQQYTHGSCYISLFKFKSFDQLIPPNCLKFRHLLSCGTIGLHIKLKDEIAHSDHHSTFMHIKIFVLCIICMLDFSDKKLWDCLCLLRMHVAIKE